MKDQDCFEGDFSEAKSECGTQGLRLTGSLISLPDLSFLFLANSVCYQTPKCCFTKTFSFWRGGFYLALVISRNLTGGAYGKRQESRKESKYTRTRTNTTCKRKKNLTVMHPFSYYEFRFRIRHCRRVGTSPGNIMERLKCLAVSNDRGIVAGHGRLWEQEAKMASARTERTKNREVWAIKEFAWNREYKSFL